MHEKCVGLYRISIQKHNVSVIIFQNRKMAGGLVPSDHEIGPWIIQPQSHRVPPTLNVCRGWRVLGSLIAGANELLTKQNCFLILIERINFPKRNVFTVFIEKTQPFMQRNYFTLQRLRHTILTKFISYFVKQRLSFRSPASMSRS